MTRPSEPAKPRLPYLPPRLEPHGSLTTATGSIITVPIGSGGSPLPGGGQ